MSRLFGVATRSIVVVGVLLGSQTLPAQAITVKRDLGGSVAERIQQVRQLSATGTPVRIEGTCISACTLLLGVPTTCVSPQARLGFHGPSSRLRGIPLPPEEYERVSRQMAEMYPAELRRWFMAKARLYTTSYLVISGGEAIRMGARACD